MASPFLTHRSRAAIMATYLPHQVQVQYCPDYGQVLSQVETRVATLDSIDYYGWQKPAILRLVSDVTTAESAQLVLYSLADLPQLPDELLTLVARMDFVSTLDLGAGEYVNRVEVLSASDTELRLAVGTGYRAPDESYHTETDDFIEDESDEGYQAGPDYQVIVSAFGDIHWRNVTADELANPPRPVWQLLSGSRVLAAFAYLVELHVAVGEIAVVERDYDSVTQAINYSSRYVRKQVKGGVNRG